MLPGLDSGSSGGVSAASFGFRLLDWMRSELGSGSPDVFVAVFLEALPWDSMRSELYPGSSGGVVATFVEALP